MFASPLGENPLPLPDTLEARGERLYNLSVYWLSPQLTPNGWLNDDLEERHPQAYAVLDGRQDHCSVNGAPAATVTAPTVVGDELTWAGTYLKA